MNIPAANSPHSWIGDWRAVFRALRYPLYLEPCLFILFATFFIWFGSTSVGGMFMLIAFSIGLAQYLLLNLRHVAGGADVPPHMSAQNLFPMDLTPVKLALTVLMWFALTKSIGEWWPAGAWLMTATGFLFAPAFVTLLALEDSLHYALNPVRLVRFVLRGGLLYLLFAAGLMALLPGMGIEVQLELLLFDPPPLENWLRLFGGAYVGMASVYVLGTIARTAHDYQPPAGHQVDEARPPDSNAASAVAERLHALLGKEDREAIRSEWTACETRDLAFQRELHEELLRRRAWALVPWQARRLTELFLNENRLHDALQLTLRTLATHESFATKTAEDWLRLCGTAAQAGRGDWLNALAEKAPLRFPDSIALLDIDLLRARFMATQDNDLQGALDVLKPHLQRTSHPRHNELMRLHGSLREMLGSR